MLGVRSIRTFAVVVAVAGLTAACDVAASTQSAESGAEAAGRAQDVAAQSELRNVLVAAKTLYTNTASYDGIAPTSLAAVEPALCYVGSATGAVASGAACEGGAGAGSISIFGQAQQFAAAAMSESGTCFWVRDVIGAGTTYGSGEPCTGSAALGASGSSF